VGEFLQVLVPLAFCAAAVATAGAVLGGYVVSQLAGAGRHARDVMATVEPADAFDGYDGDGDTAVLPVGGLPGERTLEIVIPRPEPVTVQLPVVPPSPPPWWNGGRHAPERVAPVDDTMRLPRYLSRPDLYPSDEYPQLAARERA
jgi:hypothetical protein